MMKITAISLSFLLGVMAAANAASAREGFVVKGCTGLPDGYSVSICCSTDTAFSTEVVSGVTKGGRFVLKGRIGKPQPGTLMTNNLDLVTKNGWPTDSIRWTYTDVFLSDDDITVDKDFKVSGGQIQTDFNEWQRQKSSAGSEETTAAAEAFIAAHPQSVISVWLANNMLKRGYNLTMAQVEKLERTIVSVPGDTARFAEFGRRIAFAKKTVKGARLIDLELEDIKGNVCRLTDIVPKNRFVLIDFWASWCGICIAAMPEIRQIADEHKDRFSVIGVSIDTKREAWTKAMERHPEPWPQYVTTKRGYGDLFHKYQVGNGVPYYVMLAPDGTVITSPPRPAAVKEILKQYE